MDGVKGLFKDSTENSRTFQDCANPARPFHGKWLHLIDPILTNYHYSYRQT